jgi:hypothetical protein
VLLERRERCEVWAEPRLRAAELETEPAVASARLGVLTDGRPRSRRPDLVLSFHRRAGEAATITLP